MAQNIIDLEVWKKGRIFRNGISKITSQLSKQEQFRLSDQLIRASRSVTANIAEGHGRFHFQENIQFCRQARGSLIECYDHLTVALDEGYISMTIFDEFAGKYEELIKMLNGYISYLKKRKQEG